MPEPRPEECQAGEAALARGAWEDARGAFDRAIATRESPEAFEGRGLAGWWLDLADVVFDSRERACRLYRDRGDRAGAAGWRSGSPGTRGRSATSTPSPAAGSSAPARCSTAWATYPSP